MSGASDELLSKKAKTNNEEDLISETLSHQKIRELTNENDEIELCANCGKEGTNLNICNKCKESKYCNAACKKKHRSKHKKQCERRVAELHDDALFREPPPEHGDCPICFLRLPTMDEGRMYMACCGKMICTGCCYADVYDNHGKIIADKKCPFCRTPLPTSGEEGVERLKKRMEVGDAYAFGMMGCLHDEGDYGVPQDSAKALEFWHKAGKFGYANIGLAYSNGKGVERDEKMAKHYYELAAMEGCETARHNLGLNEYNAGNFDKALNHHMIAVRGGHTKSLKVIQRMYKEGHVTKCNHIQPLMSCAAVRRARGRNVNTNILRIRHRAGAARATGPSPAANVLEDWGGV